VDNLHQEDPSGPWYDKFKQLAEYKNNNHHLNINAYEDPDLYFWLSNQKSSCRNGSISPQKRTLLETLGVDWRVKYARTKTNSSPRKSWEEHFNEMKAFQQKNGHCEVSYRENYSLFRWANYQKHAIKAGHLSNKQISLLESIHFLN
jgi:hypothetical protein